MNNLHQRLSAILQQQFGFKSFRPGQEEVLVSLLKHQNTLGVLPTGAGKTLIYQLFGCLNPHLMLVISPLLSLMQDQVSRMQYAGIKNAFALNSLLNQHQKRWIFQHLNEIHYLYISPEMLSNPRLLAKLKQIQIGLVVIDEAHCISQWGPDFRPDYLNLKWVLQVLHNPQILMLTATASENIRRDIILKLGLKTKQVNSIVYPVDRPNIYLDVQTVTQESDKLPTLMHLIQHLKMPGVIYFSSKKQANQVADLLKNKLHLRAEPYHSGLSDATRYHIQHQFMENQIDTICATSAFGMGIDKDDLRFVIHYHLPADLGSYMQEIGRAGRDGKQSIAILLYCDGDESLPYQLTIQDVPNGQFVESFYQHPSTFLKQGAHNVQIQVLNFYYQHHYSAQQTANVFENYRRTKIDGLRQMLGYVKTKHCKRKFLLKAFNQKAPQHQSICCNYRRSVNLKRLGLYVKHHQIHQASSTEWLEVLKKLFNVSKK